MGKRHRKDGVARSHSPVRVWIQYPVLLAVLLVVLLELLVYALLRVIAALMEFLLLPKHRNSHRSVGRARSYEEWKDKAMSLDEQEGKGAWRSKTESEFYDYRLISANHELLDRLLSQPNEEKELLEILQRLAHKNVGGVNNVRLYNQTHLGTKDLVRSYYKKVCECIERVARSPALSLEERRDFLQRVELSYGKTALCLSGGGTMGYYHLGVLKALWENSLLPTVISGTSAGALVGSLVCTRTDAELHEVFSPEVHRQLTANDEPLSVKLGRLWAEGSFFDPDRWLEKTREVVGDYTFAEAYRRSGRIFNISLSAENKHASPKLLNCVTAPNVLIYSAVVASSAMPVLLRPINLLVRTADGQTQEYSHAGARWSDGSLTSDIPYASLSQLFGINFFVVSQANPHIVPFFWGKTGTAGQPIRRRRARGYRGGFATSALEILLKLDMAKWMRFLSELQLIPRILGTDLSALFLQTYVGSVTIVPGFKLSDYLNIIKNPSRAAMDSYIRGGEANTWPKLSMIKTSYRIERCIENCLDELSCNTMFNVLYRHKDELKAEGMNPDRDPAVAWEEEERESDELHSDEMDSDEATPLAAET